MKLICPYPSLKHAYDDFKGDLFEEKEKLLERLERVRDEYERLSKLLAVLDWVITVKSLNGGKDEM